jgi:hypothetical protein
MPYVGAGPQFGLIHKGFETDDLSKVNMDGVTIIDNRTRPQPFRFQRYRFQQRPEFHRRHEEAEWCVL